MVFLKKNKVENFSRSFYVQNNKDEEIKLTVFYQLPKSTNDKLDIKLTEPTTDFKLTQQNHVQTNVTVKPRDSMKLTFGYTIEYPEAKFLNVVKQFL